MRPTLLAAALLALAVPAGTAALLAPTAAVAEDAALRAAVASEARPAADRARDAFRRPYESLTFWGLTPGMTVVEIQPGAAGWWSNILQPYLAATGGTWVGANNAQQLAAVADGSADMVLVARSIHGWHRAGATDARMAEFARILKPGGILAVEQHRAAEGTDPDATAPTGYVSEAYVIAAAGRAGLVLDERSELNANTADDRDHPFGVWTLPPVRTSQQGERTLTAEERAAFDAIGESDRMTLRLRKPAG
ncbi:MAG TPA: methyltransferase domain-containing protein [Brevundimonas sp.]|jgi:predicted methyltransferase|uniref:class I SAM-dependent methyltransferase n=1 Tax=Brevundimonas sp. TaxID=1871086 RepID=UPI002E1172E5|nr:methyltransferase domain-containing protein [Brevundimonas sp.]